MGVWLGQGVRVARAAAGVIVFVNVTRALPTLALLTIFATTSLGFGNKPTVLAAAIFALPVILANTHAGMLGVDPDVLDAARGMGMARARIVGRVYLPLAMPLIATGLRTSTVQVVGGGGLGRIVIEGFGIQNYGQVIAGGVLIAGLCLVIEVALGLAQRAFTPRYVALSTSADRR